MALAFATHASVKRTTNVVPSTSDYTCVVLYTPTNGSSTTSAVVFATFQATTSNQTAAIYNDSLTKFYLWVGDTTTFAQSITATVPDSVASSFAYTRTGTTHKYYVNGKLIDTIHIDISADTFAEVRLGDDEFAGNGHTSQVQNFREWQRELTQAEIILEHNSTIALATTVWTDTPLDNDLLDDSGNGHTWTTVGTCTFTTSVIPVVYTNTTATTAAIVILDSQYFQIPKSGTLSTTGTTWFKFTATTGDVLVGAFGFGNMLGASGYRPIIRPWTGTASTLTDVLGISGVNIPVQFPVTVGDTYWLREALFPSAASTAQAALNFSVNRSVNSTIPVGSVLINDSSPGFPLIAMNATTGTVIGVKYPFPSGEELWMLPTGEVAAADNDVAGEDEFVSFNNQMVEIARPTIPGVGALTINANNNDLFYTGRRSSPGVHSTVYTVTTTGAVGATTWDLGSNGLRALAPSRDNTILYYDISGSTPTNKPVKRWDLVNDTTLSDLVGGFASDSIRDMQVLPDETILVAYVSGNVRHFSTTGTTINTFTFSGLEGIYISGTSGTLFGLWQQPDNQYSIFSDILVSTGAVNSSTGLTTKYTSGVYGGSETPVPSARFGSDFSCQPIKTVNALNFSSGTSGSTTGVVIVIKVTDPADDTTSFDFVSSTTPTSFSLAGGGVQMFSTVAVGTVSITEVATTTHQSTVEVSNGSTPSSISVTAGETVTITFTNFKLEPLSGLYILVPDKKYDTIYASIRYDPPPVNDDGTPGQGSTTTPTFTTEDREIPEPSAELYLAGDE